MIKLVCVGSIKEKALESCCREYLKRLSSFFRLRIIEVKDEPEQHHARNDLESIKEIESKRVLSQLKENDFVILLDLQGKDIDSIAFSKAFGRWRSEHGDIVFVIAGSHGPDKTLRARADYLWKLSNLTFPHQLCRLLVLEQIYRAMMIEAGRSYHK